MIRKFILITLSVIVIVGMCAALLAMQAAKVAEGQGVSKGSPNTTRVLVNIRNDGPVDLQIVNPESAGVDPYAPEVEITITNTSNKGVSAYAIKHKVEVNGEVLFSGVDFGRFSTARSVLRPRDSRTEHIGGAHYSLPIDRLVVFVDFLEFTDGTTWGGDTSSTRDLLAGLRAGEEATAKHLRWLLIEQGSASFARELERADEDSSIPLGESSKWRNAFQQGMALIKARVKREARDFSPMEIEKVLSQPNDALDEIRRSTR